MQFKHLNIFRFNFLQLVVLSMPLLIVNVKHASELVILFLTIFGIYFSIRERKLPFFHDQLKIYSYLVLAFFMSIVISVILSNNPIQGIHRIGSNIHFLFAPFVAYSIYKSNVDLKHIVFATKLSIILGSSYAFYSNSYLGYRAEVGADSPTIFGFIMVLFGFISIINIWTQSKKEKLFSIFIFFLAIYSVVLSGTRIAWVMFVILFFSTIFIWFIRGYLTKKRLLLILTVLTVLTTFFMNNKSFNNRIDSAFNEFNTFSEDTALTLDEVKELFSDNSLPFKYKGANQTNLISNGTFDDATDWTFTTATPSSGWSVNNGYLEFTAGDTEWASTPCTFIKGKSYAISFDVVDGAGLARLYFEDINSVYINFPPGERHTHTFVAEDSARVLKISAASGFATKLDNMTATQIRAVAEYDSSSVSAPTWVNYNGESNTISDCHNIRSNTGSIELRLLMWISGLTAFKQQPIIGYGYQNTGLEASRYIPSSYAKEFIKGQKMLHNDYINSLVGFGILGLLVLLALLFFPLTIFFKRLKADQDYTKNAIGVLFIIALSVFAITDSIYSHNVMRSFVVFFLGVLLPVARKE